MSFGGLCPSRAMLNDGFEDACASCGVENIPHKRNEMNAIRNKILNFMILYVRSYCGLFLSKVVPSIGLE